MRQPLVILAALLALTPLGIAPGQGPIPWGFYHADTFTGIGTYGWCCRGAPDTPTALLCEANPMGHTLTGALVVQATHEPAHLVLHAAFAATQNDRSCTEERTCLGVFDGFGWFGPCLVTDGFADFAFTPQPDGTWHFVEEYYGQFYAYERLEGNVAVVAAQPVP